MPANVPSRPPDTYQHVQLGGERQQRFCHAELVIRVEGLPGAHGGERSLHVRIGDREHVGVEDSFAASTFDLNGCAGEHGHVVVVEGAAPAEPQLSMKLIATFSGTPLVTKWW